MDCILSGWSYASVDKNVLRAGPNISGVRRLISGVASCTVVELKKRSFFPRICTGHVMEFWAWNQLWRYHAYSLYCSSSLMYDGLLYTTTLWTIVRVVNARPNGKPMDPWWVGTENGSRHVYNPSRYPLAPALMFLRLFFVSILLLISNLSVTKRLKNADQKDLRVLVKKKPLPNPRKRPVERGVDSIHVRPT